MGVEGERRLLLGMGRATPDDLLFHVGTARYVHHTG